MKITGFETAELRIGLKKPFITALRRVDEINDIVIKVHTDSDLVGYGEACAVTAITGTTNEDVLHELKASIFPALLNQEVHSQTIFKTLDACVSSPEAKACMDIALYDLLAKEADKSLSSYLGASSRVLQTDLTISVAEPKKMAEDTVEALNQGFRLLKIKLDGDTTKNIRRLNAINSVLPTDARLRLDPNQALDLKGCLSMLKAVNTDNVECLEQPFGSTDIISMKRLKEKAIVPILADESLFSFADAQKLLEDKAVDMLNIKLMKSGGIHEAIRIAKLAQSYKKSCMIGSMLEGPISLLAAAHYALSQENIIMADLDSPLYLKEHPLLEAFHFTKDKICLDEKVGLGVDEIMKGIELF